MLTRTASILGVLTVAALLVAACAPAAPAATPTPVPAAKAATTPATVAKAEATPTTKPAPPPATAAPTPKPEKLKMATPSTGLVEMAQQIAKKKGYFAQENLEVEITRVAPDIAVKALVGGELDFIFTLGSAVRATAAGVPIKTVLATISKPYHVLVVRPEIKEGKDLKGKVFAVASPGDSPTQMIRAALKQYGLDPDKDGTFVTLGGNPERLAGLKGGAVQGTVLEPLYAVKAVGEGMKQLLKMADIMDMPLAGLSLSDKTLKERPDMVLRAVRATVKGLKFIKDTKNKDEIIAYFVTEMNVTKEEASATYPDIIRAFSDDGIPTTESVMREVQIAVETAGAKAGTTINDVFDYSFANKVKAGG